MATLETGPTEGYNTLRLTDEELTILRTVMEFSDDAVDDDDPARAAMTSIAEALA